MFYWVGDGPPPAAGQSREDWLADDAAGNWVEIWNDVFIQYEWQGEALEKGYRKTGMPDLPFRSIDTGMGLERTAMVLGGQITVYDTDGFTAIFAAIDRLSPKMGSTSIVVGPSWSTVSETILVSDSQDINIKKSEGRHLPHWSTEGATYFVTFRLTDSVPSSRRDQWRAERDELARLEAAGVLSDRERASARYLLREEVDRYLDAGAGECLLNDPRAATIVADALKHFDQDRYDLWAWVVMPNHVHALVTPRAGNQLSSVLHSWKSFTANAINQTLGRSGDVWMDESYDHIVRNQAEFTRYVNYILENPVKARLVDWQFVGTPTKMVGDTVDQDGPTTANKIARRVIADHIRTATFCIADGILPSNTGRGYVLRRLIRRAVLKGDRALGITDTFLYRVFDGVVEAMGHAYPELEEQRSVIVETLKNEEEAFRRTLARGLSILEAELQEMEATQTTSVQEVAKNQLDGEVAFQLYDTYGFPLEVTVEIAGEHAISVDIEGYDRALKAAQALARGAQGEKSAYGDVNLANEEATADAPETTEFLGYSALEATGRIVRVRPAANGFLVALDQTPFYAQSGGQAGDSGTLQFADGTEIAVEETTKNAGTFWHSVRELPADALGQTVFARVDADRRNRTQPHHTGTHLLHLALREALGAHATQAGSYVGPDRLRFDFTHGTALTAEQREQIEQRVNELAQANFDVVTHVDISPEEAKARGAMALFGEKYGNKVRMVEVGPSKELCGGTHVRTSAEVLPFRILAEASAASGIRRIEAVAGPAARELAQQERAQLATLAHTLKTVPHELSTVVDKLLGQLKEERQKREAIERKLIAGGTDSAATTVTVGPVSLKVQNFGEMDAKVATSAIDDAVAANPLLVFVGAVLNGDKVAFTAKAGAEAVKHGVHAGKLVGEVARIAGGGGGGRPDFATAGGKDASQTEAALAIAESVLSGQIK
jgi:alanine--tRNA ligase